LILKYKIHTKHIFQTEFKRCSKIISWILIKIDFSSHEIYRVSKLGCQVLIFRRKKLIIIILLFFFEIL